MDALIKSLICTFATVLFIFGLIFYNVGNPQIKSLSYIFYLGSAIISIIAIKINKTEIKHEKEDSI